MLYYFIKNGGTGEIEVTDSNEKGFLYNMLEADSLEEAKEKAKKVYLRDDRIALLDAFDIWEKAVIRGRELDSTEIMDWYNDILDLKESAFENIPDRIKHYMQ